MEFSKIKKLFFKSKILRGKEIDPDEIFLDSSNLPEFDTHQFEGRIEKAISRKVLVFTSFFFIAVALIFIGRLWNLQIKQGMVFAARSENNRLRNTLVFPDRGVIFDRNRTLLAWNEDKEDDPDFSQRRYATSSGFSNLLGYVKYPSKDSAGFYYREDYLGVDGVEKFYNDLLKGTNGTKLTETDVFGKIESQSIMNLPQNGTNIELSIDARLQTKLYSIIEATAKDRGFTGGAGIMMNVKTGEILTLVTYPEYSSQVLTDGTNTEMISKYFADKSNPLLDRATSGLYTPGSIVKPIMAMAALNEGVIEPNKVLYTTGSISIKNPYNPDITYVYKDWQNQGPVDMRKAIQQSSDVYFYEVGGGYQDQKGMGILNIEKYSRIFGLGEEVGAEFFGNKKGTIPSPEWKKATFNGEEWTVGNTYHSVIGQYGFQVTPIQMVRAVGAIANYGKLMQPTILLHDSTAAQIINLPKKDFDVVHEGMRLSALDGTARALNVPYVEIAAKTGTAELGVAKDFVNSWVTGFFPYKDPEFAFVILMEKGPVHNVIGAPAVSRQWFDWINQNAPEYFE